ncbi:hypothetical protein CROQUDRAFT_51793 [Cronartium quercuum f. sp. fusiforme G11]|uniref:Uncharacterized protein n=1 Tax=Cronartium quercuum f. sp. fusiforme G11 TaxID=708437 RepID=A0A9P6N832_9BASI|nr:hypothetical protein CROQUDRAFT_51793 [Cronartium quercuum f. sp. fusiforme G11]
MTWNGIQGFRKPIESDFLVKGQSTLGRWVKIELSGHMLTQYQPKAAFQMFEYLLGSS